MNKGISGNLYWIASGQKTWFHDLGKWLYELTGTSVQYVAAPTYTSQVDVGNFVVDNSKLSLLGWKPNISAKYGISKTLDYFKENSL